MSIQINNIDIIDDSRNIIDSNINLANNSLSCSFAQLNSSISDNDLVSLNTEQTLSNKTITSPEFTGAIFANGSYRGATISSGGSTIDCSLGNYFTRSISSNTTFNLTNVPAQSYACTIRVTVSGDRSISFSGGTIRYVDSDPPTLDSDRTHLFILQTDNGGSTWRVAALANYGS